MLAAGNLLRDILKCQTHLCFWSFVNYRRVLYLSWIRLPAAIIIYRLQKDFFKDISQFVYFLGTNSESYVISIQ